MDECAIIEVKDTLRIETRKISYTKWAIDTPQQILINLEGFNEIELITLHTQSPCILLGIWYGKNNK
jgi:hypothetical protein